MLQIVHSAHSQTVMRARLARTNYCISPAECIWCIREVNLRRKRGALHAVNSTRKFPGRLPCCYQGSDCSCTYLYLNLYLYLYWNLHLYLCLNLYLYVYVYMYMCIYTLYIQIHLYHCIACSEQYTQVPRPSNPALDLNKGCSDSLFLANTKT